MTMMTEVFLMVLLAGLSAVLSLIGLISWKRTRSLKIGLVALALLFFTVKGLYMSFAAISSGEILENLPLLIIDVSAVGLLYLSVLK